MRHFIAVAESLHFGRAAARLNMAQPPLSQSIQRLEASLGTALFVRSRNHVVLTPAGSALLPHARETLAQAELAERVVLRAAAGEIARLRVGFVPWSLTTALSQALRQFRKRWQGVQVRLYERLSRQQVVQLRSGDLDLANMVANELGVALIQSTAAAMKLAGVTLVDIVDAPPTFDAEIALAWNPMLLTPPLRDFIETVESAARAGA